MRFKSFMSVIYQSIHSTVATVYILLIVLLFIFFRSWYCLYSFYCCTVYIVYIDLASWERQDLANQTVAFASECDYIKVIS